MASKNPEKPNVLFVLTDDQGCWSMGCAGNKEIDTPNLDRLAKTGLRLENFFCTSPVCSPARATLLTGRIPSQHGVHDWLACGNTTVELEPTGGGKFIEYLKGVPGYTDFLSAAGYQCGLSGKWHLGDSHHPQKGFDFWEVHAKGGSCYYKAPMVKKNGELYKASGYVTDVITENALTFLENEKITDNPFYLSVHYTAPHSPWSRENHATEIYDQYYNHCAFESVPSDLTPPVWVRHLSIPVKDAETRRAHLSGYYTAVKAMDSNVGRLIDWLETNGLRENTLIVFSADNGMNMGHHGVFGKGNATFPLNMFEESVKVPFLVSRPGYVEQGITRSQLLSQYDFMPTLLDYLNIANPEADHLPGKSFANVFTGDSPSKEHDHIVVFDEYGPVRMIRTNKFKYIHRYPYGPHELYDLKEDPREGHNLADDPDYALNLKELRQELREWFLQYAHPERDGIYAPVTGNGQQDQLFNC